MAIELPTTSLQLDRRDFRAGQAIRSGVDAADRHLGFRGISAECNHAYAYLTQTLCAMRRFNDEALDTVTDTSYVYGPKMEIEVGEHIDKLRLVIDLEDGYVDFDTEHGNTVSLKQLGRGVTTVTHDLTDNTGPIMWLRFGIKVDVAETCNIYGWVIQEVEMVAGDFP